MNSIDRLAPFRPGVRWRHILLLASILIWHSMVGQRCFAWQNPAAIPVTPVDEVQQIRQAQAELAARYSQLEAKLFSLAEFERDRNPDRAELLERAFLKSQESMMGDRLQAIASLLQNAQLKQAQDGQQQALTELTQLLELLQSDTRTEQIRDEQKRLQALLKDVIRLTRVQQGIRGQAERDAAPRLAEPQKRVADQTQQLLDRSRESGGPATEAPSDASGDSATPSTPNPNSPSPSNDPDQDAEPQGPPHEQSLERAIQQMRSAEEQLRDAKQNPSVEAMRDAEAELEAARRELERILRQLREEEVGQILSRLEERFRQMLEAEIKLREQTQTLVATPPEQRGTDFQLTANRLSLTQKQVAGEAGKVLVLLYEDGTSAAFPASVEEIQLDMLQVADRLASAQVNAVTLGLQQDIIDALNQLVAALEQLQRENEQNQPAQSPQGGPSNSSPLVSQLAELRLLRAMQERIHVRHQRYAGFLQDPNDPVGATADPDMAEALDRLADRQRKLTELANQLVREAAKR